MTQVIIVCVELGAFEVASQAKPEEVWLFVTSSDARNGYCGRYELQRHYLVYLFW